MKERDLLILAPVVCGLAAAALAVASLASYRVADVVDYPGWLPTFGGIIVALPALLLSARSFLAMRRETATEYNLNRTKAMLGSLAFVLVAAVMIAYIFTVGDEGAYKGDFNPATGRYEPLFRQATFVTASAILSAVMAAIIHTANHHLYFPSIDHQRHTVEGADPLGQLMTR